MLNVIPMPVAVAMAITSWAVALIQIARALIGA